MTLGPGHVVLTASLKIHIRFYFLVERWFPACSQLCSHSVTWLQLYHPDRCSRCTPCPLVSTWLQHTPLTSFLICPTQHVLTTTSSSFCYCFMVCSDFWEHWTWNPLSSACWDWTHSPRHGYPIIFLKTILREERELIVPLGFVSGKNFTSNKGDEWFGGSCLLKTSVDLPSLQYIPELVPKDC